MEKAIKTYFEEAIKTDQALAEHYDEKKIKACCKYITEQARKYLNNKNGAVEDAVVYKWARDFYFGDTEAIQPIMAEVEEEEIEVKTIPVVKAKKEKIKKPAEIDDQPSLFDFDD